MILSDQTIIDLIDAGEIEVEPVELNQIQPASLDLHLGPNFMAILANDVAPIPFYNMDAETEDDRIIYQDIPVISFSGGDNIEYVPYHERYLRAQGFVLGTTMETIKLPPDIGAVVSGRSSIGRTGLEVENAGWVDPGFQGKITLELFNSSPFPIELLSGMRVCQLVFYQLDDDSIEPYGHENRNSKYQGQDDVQGTLIDRELDR